MQKRINKFVMPIYETNETYWIGEVDRLRKTIATMRMGNTYVS